MLDRCIDPGNNVLTINNNATHVNNAGILEELNNKIYDIWYQNELAIALDVNKWPKDKNTIRRKVYGINTVFKEWFKSHDEKNTKEIIAILLQMANRGVIEITTNHKKETDITGMRQYLTIDKLAFYIIALQHYEHVSELAGIEKYCNDFKQDIKNVIRKHFAKYEEQQTGEELILYVEKLKKIYKTPSSFQARAKLHTLISTPTNINISQFNYINNKIKEDSDNYKRWENR
jgi:hypothetical protein